MSTSNGFTIYNASAGSGKTFTVVKNYLKILFQSKHPLAFKSVLALTFTNKAVGEMKARVIEMLKMFSNSNILESPNTMFTLLVKELEIEPEALHKKSKTILNTIVHNYASFDISTIDKFNHKLIRTFAYDLNLPLNFEVELDSIEVLNKAVDKLIDKAGTDRELTKVLVDFAIEKADEDKSWDIAYDFNAIAKLWIDENQIPFLETLKDKSLEDFKTLKNQVAKQIKTIETDVVSIAQNTLELIMDHGLQFEDFSSGYLPKYFEKLIHANLDVGFGLKWQTDLIEGTALYPKRVPLDVAELIDSIQPELATHFSASKAQIIEHKFLKNVYKNITPLSVLNEIYKTLQELKEEDNILLISEFNSIISEEINKQPVPFIYERIGEKFKHYFIDEFQDTSVLQWENLTPLIENALSGETLKGERGSAMLVGDAKQAIYRWRGGKPEQFIDLCNNKNPFFVDKTVENLPVNYRSSKAIVNFNNEFFKHISGFAFSNPEHQSIFENSHQDNFLEHKGFVEISFLDTLESDKNLLYCEKVLNTINKAKAIGYNLSDICIITRKTREGIVIAEFLSEQNIAIVSSETLMLQNSPEVNFIVNLIALVNQPQNDKTKIELLTYLAEYQLNLDDKHAFYCNHVHLDAQSLFKALEVFGFYFSLDVFIRSPLYEAVETIISAFRLNKTSNAYIQFFLDEVLEYSLKNHSDFLGFLNYWERKKDRLSIVSPQSKGAVQIMTIHKSKGLEFPVVIFPFANQDIYFDMNPKVWFPVDEHKFNGFPYMYINLNKDLLEDYSALGYEIYNDYKSKLELDSINLLYVVLTRAVEQLYVISELDLDKNGNEKPKYYSGLFIDYLKFNQRWNSSQLEYTFGIPERALAKDKGNEAMLQTQLISTSREGLNLNILTNSGYLWDTAQEKAIERGNLIHLIMSQIKTENDIDFVFEDFLDSGKINKDQMLELKPIVNAIINHKQLKAYFKSNQTIYNEKDIITKQGVIVRPDRVVINNNDQAVILDYKTGDENPRHKEQLQTYQDVLEDMNFEVVKKILVYVNQYIQIKEF
ncbi:MAG TPA: UvrD-helicase domain-containing protein [Flavobacteriaceae bacterium]